MKTGVSLRETGRYFCKAVLDNNQNGSATIELVNGQSATIHGLSHTDVYTVTENDYSGDGYTTYIGSDEKRSDSNSIEAATTLAFTNDKNVSTPTGIILSFAPYILLVAIAGVFAVSFLRKKREEF